MDFRKILLLKLLDRFSLEERIAFLQLVIQWLQSCPFNPWLIKQVDKVMALVVSDSLGARIKRFIFGAVEDGDNPRNLFSFPVYQRRDGYTIRLGAVVKTVERDDPFECENPLIFCIKDILISMDLAEVFVCLLPVMSEKKDEFKVLHTEELTLPVSEVEAYPGGKLLQSVSMETFAKIGSSFSTYPPHIQRVARKHQISSCIRRQVQAFLAGFAMAKKWSVGSVDWSLDLGIFGLEQETGFSLEFHIEKYLDKTAHIDLLLGDCWDVRQLSGGNGYRALLTFDLWINASQDIEVQAHAVTCSSIFDRVNHRKNTFEELAARPGRESLVLPLNRSQPNTSRDDGSTGLTQLLETARSLIWEEFQVQKTPEISPEKLGETVIKGMTGNSRSSGERVTPDSVAKDGETVAANGVPKVIDSTIERPVEFAQLIERINLNSDQFYKCSPVINARSLTGREEEAGSRSLSNSGKSRKSSTPHEEVPGGDDSLLPKNVSISIIKARKSEDSTSLDRTSLNDRAEASEPTPQSRKFSGSKESLVCTPFSKRSAEARGARKRTTPRRPMGPAVGSDSGGMSRGQSHTGSVKVRNVESVQKVLDEERSRLELRNKSMAAELNFEDLEDTSVPDLSIMGMDSPVITKVSEYLQSLPDSIPVSPLPPLSPLSPTGTTSPVDYKSKRNGDASSPSGAPLKVPDLNDSAGSVRTSKDGVAANATNTSTTSPGGTTTDKDTVDGAAASADKMPPKGRAASSAEDNRSVGSSRSRTSMASDRSNLTTGRFSQQGAFYGIPAGSVGPGPAPACPFPEEWQFNTIPEQP